MDGLYHVFEYLNCLTPCLFVCRLWNQTAHMFPTRPSGSRRGVGCRGLLRYCAKHNYLDLFKWARANGAPMEIKVATKATKGQHLEVLRWLYANNLIGRDDAIYDAIILGNMDIFKWWKRYGNYKGYCPTHRTHMATQMAKYGRLQMLKELNPYLSEKTISKIAAAATDGDHVSIIKWVLNPEREYDMRTDINRVIVLIAITAIGYGNKAILEYQNQCDQEVDLDIASIDKKEPNTCERTHETKSIKWSVLNFLATNGHSGRIRAAIITLRAKIGVDATATENAMEALKWLDAEYPEESL